MRTPTLYELKTLEEILDWIRPIIDLEYVYIEEENVILIGDNYLIRGGTQRLNKDVYRDVFNLIYGENHPGYTSFDLSRWEEEDIATSPNIPSLLPVFISSLVQRLAEDRVYSKLKLAELQGG